MRKMIKKVITGVMAAAMVLTTAVTSNTAKAFAADDTYYIIGDAFGNWTLADAPEMTKAADGTYSYSFTATASQVVNFQILPTNTSWDGQIGAAAGGNFAGLALEAGQATIKFDPSKEGDARITMEGLVSPNPAEEYYVVGGMNGWSTTEGTKMTKNADGKYEAVFENITGDKYEFKIAQDAPTYGWYKSWGVGDGNASNTEGLAWDKETLTVVFDPATGEITSSAVEVTVPADDDSDADSKDEDATPADPDATTVTVHVSTDWLKPKFYAFGTEDSTVQLTGGWPGVAMSANADNDGYVSAKITLDETADITVIINGSDSEGNSVQTVNIPLTVKDGANEYWITIGDLSTEADEFGNVNYTATTTTTAPEGWVAGEVEDSEVPDSDDGDDADDSDDGDDADDSEDSDSAWADAKLKVHVKMPEGIDGWEKLGIYLFGTGESFGWSGGSGELAGAWPGTELQLENDSETWYAFGGTFADGYYMAIINNFVSDDEAAEGATKLQAADLELVDGEYWITIEANEDGTYTANVVTEAPDDYDGTGLDSVAEAPETSDDDDAANNGSSSDAKEDPAGGNTAGAPIAAAMVLAMFAATAVVVNRKRKVA